MACTEPTSPERLTLPRAAGRAGFPLGRFCAECERGELSASRLGVRLQTDSASIAGLKGRE